jgi:hypothetical protein
MSGITGQTNPFRTLMRCERCRAIKRAASPTRALGRRLLGLLLRHVRHPALRSLNARRLLSARASTERQGTRPPKKHTHIAAQGGLQRAPVGVCERHRASDRLPAHACSRVHRSNADRQSARAMESIRACPAITPCFEGALYCLCEVGPFRVWRRPCHDAWIRAGHKGGGSMEKPFFHEVVHSL